MTRYRRLRLNLSPWACRYRRCRFRTRRAACEQYSAGGLHDWRRPGPLWTGQESEPPRRVRDGHPLQPECARRQARRAPPGDCPKRIARGPADESHQSQCRHRTHGRRGRSKETGPGNRHAQCQKRARNRHCIRAVAGCQGRRDHHRHRSDSAGSTRADRRVCQPAQAPSRRFRTPVRSGGWALELWPEHQLDVSTGRRLCRSDPQGRAPGGDASHAADQVRAGRQLEDRQGARPGRATDLAGERRRGDRMMRRREFIALLGGAAAWPLAARAQQPAMPVIGFVSGRSPGSDAYLVEGFRRGLRENGFTEGQNVVLEFRWADGRLDRLPAMTAELIERKVAVLFAGAADVAAGALRVASAIVPVVFATGSDPVESGLVARLNRPGGNLTGVTVITNTLWPKRLELLRELLPTTPLIALLVNPTNLAHLSAVRELNEVARKLGQEVLILPASVEADFETTFAALVEKRASALIVSDDALFTNRRDVLAELAARHAVPAIYGRRDFAVVGGLMSYGASPLDQYYQSGFYVGRILRGAKPADLPFLLPTKFELTLNLRTAKALGLDIPPTLLARADEVIE